MASKKRKLKKFVDIKDFASLSIHQLIKPLCGTDLLDEVEITPGEVIEPKEEDPKQHDTYVSKDSLKWYFETIRQEKILTPMEEMEYIKKAQKGNIDARDKIIKSHLRLVIKIAQNYKSFLIPLIDLIAEGNIGLMRALEKFKPALGFRFSTYATWWIKQSISRAIANQRNTIRIPVHILDIYHKYLKLTEKIRRDTGCLHDNENVAKKLGITPLKLYEILNIVQTPKSLTDTIYNADPDNSWILSDTTEDISAVKPDEHFFEKVKNEKILEFINLLTAKEVEVILARFGINNTQLMTLEDIGTKLHLTRERIRQIEVGAIKKLKYLLKNADK